jgi:C1A family cysteine protease
MRPAADYIEMTGPKGRLQSVHWPDRPDVFGPIAADGLPVWVNWTRWPAVTPVVDQGPFDACWAHSTTSSVEGLNSIRTHHIVDLSAQQLIDCCVKERDDPFDALNYIVKNGGILAEADYPYVGYCQAPQNIVVCLRVCVFISCNVLAFV